MLRLWNNLNTLRDPCLRLYDDNKVLICDQYNSQPYLPAVTFLYACKHVKIPQASYSQKCIFLEYEGNYYEFYHCYGDYRLRHLPEGLQYLEKLFESQHRIAHTAYSKACEEWSKVHLLFEEHERRMEVFK